MQKGCSLSVQANKLFITHGTPTEDIWHLLACKTINVVIFCMKAVSQKYGSEEKMESQSKQIYFSAPLYNVNGWCEESNCDTWAARAGMSAPVSTESIVWFTGCYGWRWMKAVEETWPILWRRDGWELMQSLDSVWNGLLWWHSNSHVMITAGRWLLGWICWMRYLMGCRH